MEKGVSSPWPLEWLHSVARTFQADGHICPSSISTQNFSYLTKNKNKQKIFPRQFVIFYVRKTSHGFLRD